MTKTDRSPCPLRAYILVKGDRKEVSVYVNTPTRGTECNGRQPGLVQPHSSLRELWNSVQDTSLFCTSLPSSIKCKS